MKRLKICVLACMFALLSPIAHAKNCDAYRGLYQQASAKYGIPDGLLEALSMTETGCYPWQTEWNGHPPKEINSKSYEEAVSVATDLVARHQNIDSGIMAWNQTYHPDKSKTLADIYKPSVNVEWAAHYLTELYNSNMSGHSWLIAAALYHRFRRDAEFERYRLEVVNNLAIVRGNVRRICGQDKCLNITVGNDPEMTQSLEQIAARHNLNVPKDSLKGATALENAVSQSEDFAVQASVALRAGTLKELISKLENTKMGHERQKETKEFNEQIKSDLANGHTLSDEIDWMNKSLPPKARLLSNGYKEGNLPAGVPFGHFGEQVNVPQHAAPKQFENNMHTEDTCDNHPGRAAPLYCGLGQSLK